MDKNKYIKVMNIVFVGGGTGGSVSPLLAVIDQLRKRLPSCKVVWFGTRQGPERIMTRGRVDRYVWIANGKLRRYMSWRNPIVRLKPLGRFLSQAKKLVMSPFNPTIQIQM